MTWCFLCSFSSSDFPAQTALSSLFPNSCSWPHCCLPILLPGNVNPYPLTFASLWESSVDITARKSLTPEEGNHVVGLQRLRILLRRPHFCQSPVTAAPGSAAPLQSPGALGCPRQVAPPRVWEDQTPEFQNTPDFKKSYPTASLDPAHVPDTPFGAPFLDGTQDPCVQVFV